MIEPTQTSESGPGSGSTTGAQPRTLAPVTGPATALPDDIMAKLRPPAEVRPGAMALGLAAVTAWLAAARRHARAALPARLSAMAIGEHLAAAIAQRPRWLTLAGLSRRLGLTGIAPGRFDGLIDRARRAGVELGAALDTIRRHMPHARASEPDLPAAPGSLTASVPALDETDVSTIAVGRAVKKPSIFEPGHILTALLAGGIIHIVTTFAVTTLGNGSAYRQLRTALPSNQMVVMPAPAPGTQILPYLAPDMLYAICRFDLSAGPVAIKAVLPEIGWSVALYTRQGDNFYAAPGLQERPVPVSVLLQPASDRLINLTPGVRRADVTTSEVTSPDTEGLMVVRAPLKGIAYEALALAELKRATCTQQARR